MYISTKMSPALLWGLVFLFSMKSTRTTTPGPNTYTTSGPITPVHELKREKVTQAATMGPTQEAAKASITATAGHRVLPTGEMEKNEEVGANTRSWSLSQSTVRWSSLSTVAAEATKSLPSLSTTRAGQLNMTVGKEATQTEHQHQQSTTSFSSMITPVPTLAESSPPTVSVTQMQNISELSPTNSSALNSTASHTTTNTSGAAPVFKTSSSPEGLLTTKLSPSSQADLAISTSVSTSQAPEMTPGSSSTSTSMLTDSPTSPTSFSTSAVAILIPGDAKKIPPTKPAKATAKTPQEVSQIPTDASKVQSCSTYGVVKQCLIIIACLAALSTIFIISTIALCMRLSSKKYKVKRSQQGTEMMCISSLLPERNYTYTRQRNPVSNGVLVLPGLGDSDEDVADNLTLSSFLPDNDRYV